MMTAEFVGRVDWKNAAGFGGPKKHSSGGRRLEEQGPDTAFPDECASSGPARSRLPKAVAPAGPRGIFIASADVAVDHLCQLATEIMGQPVLVCEVVQRTVTCGRGTPRLRSIFGSSPAAVAHSPSDGRSICHDRTHAPQQNRMPIRSPRRRGLTAQGALLVPPSLRSLD
jgi:hypothetical protein